MKTINLNKLTRNILAGIISVMILLTVSSCAKNYSFAISPVVPAARGNVKVKKDFNKNWVIDVKLFNLAEVERLQDSKQTYIVWIVTDQEAAKNVGKLKSSTSVFSKQLKATLKTVSSSRPTQIFVTAETDPDVQNPGNEVILSTTSFSK